MDQNYSLMRKMNMALNVHRALTKARSAKGEEIHRLGKHDRRIIKVLIEEGLM